MPRPQLGEARHPGAELEQVIHRGVFRSLIEELGQMHGRLVGQVRSWVLHENPSATTIVPGGALRTAGSSWSSATATETS